MEIKWHTVLLLSLGCHSYISKLCHQSEWFEFWSPTVLLLNPAAVFCDQFLSYNFKPVRRIFLYLARETLFNLSKNILPLFVVVEKIDWARRERAFMFYLTAVKDITKALEAFCVTLNQLIGPLVSWKKKQLMNFWRVLLANSCFSGLIFPLFSEALRVSTWTLTSFIPNKAWQQRAAGCQNSPRQRTSSLFLKTGRHSAQCVTFLKRLVGSVC